MEKINIIKLYVSRKLRILSFMSCHFHKNPSITYDTVACDLPSNSYRVTSFVTIFICIASFSSMRLNAICLWVLKIHWLERAHLYFHIKNDGGMFQKDREKSEWKVWNNFSISEKHTFNSILIREEREFTGEYDHVNIKNDREMVLERKSDEYSCTLTQWTWRTKKADKIYSSSGRQRNIPSLLLCKNV